MFWHTRTYKTGLTVGRNATTKFDLPANVNIGSIFLRLVSQTTVGNPMFSLAKWRLIDYIDSVDIIANGSTVIKSLPGTVLSALCFYDHGKFPPDQHRAYSQAYMRNNIVINFGRFYRDNAMYIPAGKYSSLELQIKFTGTTTLFQGDPSLDIFIEQPEGAGLPAPLGLLKTEVFREYTPATAGIEYVTLPTQYKIRRVILQAWPDLDGDEIEECSPFDVLQNVKLTLQSGTVEVYNNSLEYMAKMEASVLPGFMAKHGHVYHEADHGWYSGLGYIFSGMVSAGSKAGAVAAVIPTLEADSNYGTQKLEAYTADEPVTFQAVGVMPDNCVNFRFDNDPDPSTWLNPQAEADVDLALETRSGATYADGNVKVVVDSLIPA